jgi:hypothetical protein
MKIFIKVLLVLIGLAVAGFIGYKAIKYKLDPAKQLTMSTSVITADVRNKQLECLAKNIYFEAGGESFEGYLPSGLSKERSLRKSTLPIQLVLSASQWC